MFMNTKLWCSAKAAACTAGTVRRRGIAARSSTRPSAQRPELADMPYIVLEACAPAGAVSGGHLGAVPSPYDNTPVFQKVA